VPVQSAEFDFSDACLVRARGELERERMFELLVKLVVGGPEHDAADIRRSGKRYAALIGRSLRGGDC
jgi:hypothetical protein